MLKVVLAPARSLPGLQSLNTPLEELLISILSSPMTTTILMRGGLQVRLGSGLAYFGEEIGTYKIFGTSSWTFKKISAAKAALAKKIL